MNKGELSDQLAETLSSFLPAMQWWGFGGSYAHKPKTLELLPGKDVDVIIWLTDRSKSDDILKALALLSLRIHVLIHPVVLLDHEKGKYEAIDMYRAMIKSSEIAYHSQAGQT
jgi:hypothetical protein